MGFAKWGKILWWAILLAAASGLLVTRLAALSSGDVAWTDALLLIVWLALALTPLYEEMEFLGLKLKQEVRDLRSDVAGLRAEISSAVDVRAQFSPVINMAAGAQPPDAQLPELEERIRDMLPNVLRDMGIEQPPATAEIMVPDDIAFLFSARFLIERELKRIWRESGSEEDWLSLQSDSTVRRRRQLFSLQIVRELARRGIVDDRLASAVIEVYRIASPGVHGEEVSPMQVSFVRDLAPSLVSALQAIQFEYA